MRKILAEIECGDTHGLGCGLRYTFAFHGIHICKAFDKWLHCEDGKLVRCRACLDAEKELIRHHEDLCVEYGEALERMMEGE